MEDLILTGLSLLLLAAYHLRLRWLIAHRPEDTSYGRHKVSRDDWLDHYAGGKQAIIVVQTLRNWIMSATFLASTAILLALGLLGFAFTTDKLSSFAQDLSMLGSPTPQVLFFKFLCLSLAYMTAFFSFSFSIRFLTHAGFLINLPADRPSRIPARRRHLDLQKGALSYFIGLRIYYLSVPLAFWLLGSAWLLGATILMLVLLTVTD